MKVIFTSPPPINEIPVRRIEKSSSSTTQLKQALQKIKQTQLQVLKVLRSEAETSNLTNTQMKVLTENIASITNADLMKIAEINKMKRQMQQQRRHYNDQVNAMNQKNAALQQELNRRRQIQTQWGNERRSLIERLHYQGQQNLQQNKITNSEESIKSIVGSYQQQINEKLREKLALENQIQSLRNFLKKEGEEKELLKTKQTEASKQFLQKQKLLINEIKKLEQNRDKTNPPYEDIIFEIKKISASHQKIYNSLKTKTRITIQDLDIQQQIQQSFSKILRFIDFAQKSYISARKSEENSDLALLIAKFPDNYSFGDQMKKLQKDMIESEVLKQSLSNLKQENYQLRENKIELQNSIKTLEMKLKDYQNVKTNTKNILELKQYNQLIDELKKEMNKIRQEKLALSTLVKKIGEQSIKISPQEGGMKLLRQQLDEIVSINGQLRKDNEGLRVVIDGLKLQVQTLKLQERKYEDNLFQKHVLIEKQVKQKDYLIQEIKKFQKISQDKEATCSRQDAKITELNAVIQSNFAKYQQQIKFKMDQVNALRQQIQRHMKQIRQLREIAYNYQLLDNENDVLKKKIMQVNSTVIHLWQIKETQYANIDKLLLDTKQ